MREPLSILITGASSGLGEALARCYAAKGVSLTLGGRDMDRLDVVASACRSAGADVTAGRIDVTDPDAVGRWVTETHERAPLDLVIANAGISGGIGGPDGEDEAQTRRIFTVNVDGVLNTVLPVVPLMRRRGRGQIAIMSSLAGFRGLPSAPAYSASKAAIRSWGEGLRGSLHGDGIEVSVVCPGFIRTPMTDVNNYHMPMLMDADRAARIIRRGLARNRGRIVFPFPVYALVWLFATLPSTLIDPLMRRLPAKD